MNESNDMLAKRRRLSSAVTVVDLPNKKEDPIIFEDLVLSRLLEGSWLSVESFMKTEFRKNAVHVIAPDHDDERFEDLKSSLFDLNPGAIMNETASDAVFVWLKKRNRIHSIEVDGETALHLYEAGHPIYCRAPPGLERHLVSSLLQETGMGCGQFDPEKTTAMGRGEVEMFLSTTAGHVTGWHYDFQENFTLQLSGVKKWTIQRGTVKHPLRGCTPHYNAPEAVESQLLAAKIADENFSFGEPIQSKTAIGDTETVLLKPGDLFYFPAGMWHKIEVIEPGVSMNISLMATNFATIACQALQHHLLKKEEWRQSVVTSTCLDHMQSLLSKLPEIVRDFERNNGAGAIFPPITFKNDPFGCPYNDDPDDEADLTNVFCVDELSFQSPSGGLYGMNTNDVNEWIKTFQLTRNSVATLLSERVDIASCFSKLSKAKQVSEDCDVFVLNVNFAGNESHESGHRIRFGAKTAAVQAIMDLVDVGSGYLPKDTDWLSKHVGLIDYLVFYGFLLWKKRTIE